MTPSAPSGYFQSMGQERPRPITSRVSLRSFQPATVGGDATQKPATSGCVSHKVRSSSGRSNGRGRSRTPRTTL